jgi:allantoinase
VFRVLDVLEKYGIKPTVAMDVLTAENYPYLVRRCRQHGGEMIGHGISVSRMISGKMSEQDERHYIRASVHRLKAAIGAAPVGWLGPESGESERTPQLLAEPGLRYVCDWNNDEQPYRMNTRQGELFALPVMLEMDDVNALWYRRLAIDRYAELLKEGFARMYRDGAQTGRLVVLNLHPWLIGQPFRIRYLDAALGEMVRRQGVWAATGAEIIGWYRQHPPAA